MKSAPDLRWLSDQQLLMRISAGGGEADEATSHLYLRYRRHVMRSLQYYLSGQPRYGESIEDLLHDAFIVMIDKVMAGATIHQTVPAYWIGIARFLFLNRHRKESRVILVMEPDEGYGGLAPSPEELYLDREAESRLAATFARLDTRCQQVLRLWIRHYTMQEIARVLNFSSDAMARKIKYECFKKWKALLSTHHPAAIKKSPPDPV